MNKFEISGNLTKDPELRELPSGAKVVNFSIAHNFEYSNKENRKAEFYRVAIWNNLAEKFCEECHKGSFLNLKGKMRISSPNKDNHSEITLMADKYEIIEYSKDDDKQEENSENAVEESAPEMAM